MAALERERACWLAVASASGVNPPDTLTQINVAEFAEQHCQNRASMCKTTEASDHTPEPTLSNYENTFRMRNGY